MFQCKLHCNCMEQHKSFRHFAGFFFSFNFSEQPWTDSCRMTGHLLRKSPSTTEYQASFSCISSKLIYSGSRERSLIPNMFNFYANLDPCSHDQQKCFTSLNERKLTNKPLAFIPKKPNDNQAMRIRQSAVYYNKGTILCKGFPV